MRSYITKLFGTRNVTKVEAIVKELWGDDVGALLATEWVVVATILVLGIIPGLVAIRQGNLAELTDVSNALLSLNQSYNFTGQALVCGNCDNVDLTGLQGFGGTTGNTSGINNLPTGAVVANGDVNRGAAGINGGANGVGTAQERGCRPMAITAGSAFVDTCDRINLKGVPAQPCVKSSGACD
ncbi:MAG TPA: hypothetical protein VFA26_13605 [Gemmataceae bacterium]|nr:hypothetical protein [Gemmataceae bacterium]